MKSILKIINMIIWPLGHILNHNEINLVFFHTVSTPAMNISNAITTATCLSIFNNFSSTLGSPT